MKKAILILLLLVVGGVLFPTEYIHYGHSVKCAKCVEESKRNPGHFVCVAWRTTEPYQKKDGKVYAQYHCYGGHYYWAEIKN